MYRLLRPIIFKSDPEAAHSATLNLLKIAGRIAPVRCALRRVYHAPEQPVELFGLRFKNPIGLAAGYDKDGAGWRGLACLGFGHIEVGTVTLRPQLGNPKPRVFRLVEDQAVINRMGFPGRGADYVRRQLEGSRRGFEDLVIGVNIGKNKDTPNETAIEDYLPLLQMFAPLGDYLAINVSSPNTEGLRGLQRHAALGALLGSLARERDHQQQALKKRVPLFVKLAPDLNDSELDEALEAVASSGVDGIIATNTTISRPELRSPQSNQTGGLSGAPLTALSLEMVEKIVKRTNDQIPVIGVGGIMSPDSARAMLDVGAKLVQIYTSMIYNGPGFVRQVMKALASAA